MQSRDDDKTTFEGGEHMPEKSRNPDEAVHVTPAEHASRSAVYIAQQASLEDYTPGLNPLVNCASGLLLEMVRLRTVDSKKPNPSADGAVRGEERGLIELKNRLEAQIRGFENRALGCDIDHSQVLAARYVLCTALDESVSTSPQGAQGDWSRQALLSTFHNETWGGEKFFQIIDRCIQQPARNLYLLELIYLLLSLGFEGRYKLQSRGPIELELLRERIYRQVRILRGEPSLDLCKKLPDGKYKNKIYTYVPIYLLIIFVVTCLSATYMSFFHILENRAEPLLHQFTVSSSVNGRDGK